MALQIDASLQKQTVQRVAKQICISACKFGQVKK